MPKRPPKTPKERAFVKEYAKTQNATESVARVYNVKDRDSARAIGSKVLSKVDISSVMDKIGLTDDRLMEVLKEGLDANRVLSAKIIVQGGSKAATSQTDDFIEVPDHATRHKYLDTALKLKDKYPAEKHKHQVDGAMAVPGLVQLLHKYVTPRDTSDSQRDSEAEG